MDNRLEKYIEELKEEFKSQSFKYIINSPHMKKQRLSYVSANSQYLSSFKLGTCRYAEWRCEVKLYLKREGKTAGFS